MSDNSNGYWSSKGLKDYNDNSYGGNIKGTYPQKGCGSQETRQWNSYGFVIDVQHTHAFTTSNNGGNEARPDNYTFRIWLRTA